MSLIQTKIRLNFFEFDYVWIMDIRKAELNYTSPQEIILKYLNIQSANISPDNKFFYKKINGNMYHTFNEKNQRCQNAVTEEEAKSFCDLMNSLKNANEYHQSDLIHFNLSLINSQFQLAIFTRNGAFNHHPNANFHGKNHPDYIELKRQFEYFMSWRFLIKAWWKQKSQKTLRRSTNG